MGTMRFISAAARRTVILSYMCTTENVTYLIYGDIPVVSVNAIRLEETALGDGI